MSDEKERPFILNELQREVIAGIRRKDKVIAARCGWGSGKTSSLIFAMWFLAKTRPGTTSLLITDTTPRYNSVLMPEIEKWLAPRGWVYNHTLHKWTDTHTGSAVLCRSYFRPGTRDASHNPLEGINVTSGVALVDECQTLGPEVAHKALGRLRSGPSPTLILVGLPVADAWWCRMAEEAQCHPLLFSSYVNEDNLSEAWFEATNLLPDDEREAMVMNKPKPPSGLVYQEFDVERHVISDFKYRPEMTGRITIDWGFRKPSVMIIVYDEEREASIIVHEINPQEVTIAQLSEMILRVAWPRAHKDSAPGARIWIDTGVADKAGKARSDQTGRSAFREIAKPIGSGGIGLPLRFTTDPVRTDILNGVQRLKRAFARNRYLITEEVWRKGERATGNSIRKALLSYGWDTKEQPKKDGREDPLDALRYDCIFHYWADEVNKEGYTPRARPNRNRRAGISTNPRSF
jgi:hypothetical protein